MVIISSNTIFINKIYNNAKLKVTSSFYKIGHLSYNIVKEWLCGDLGMDVSELELIYNYLGGSIAHIQKALNRLELESDKTLKNILEDMVEQTCGEITLFLLKEEKDEFYDMLKEVINEILKRGFFVISRYKKGYFNFITKMCEV